MTELHVSIIVPVYNVKDYLAECMDSLVSQTLKDIEIICIDDGSTDGSSELLDELAASDSRIVAVHRANAGVSSARNQGVSMAQGKYILFVDSDDYIAHNACEVLFDAAERDGADIVVFGGKTFPTMNWADGSFACVDKTYHNDGFGALWCEAGCIPLMCNKLYSLDFLRANDLKLNKDLSLGEDHAFQLASFPLAKTVTFVSDKLYFYRNREDSAVNSNESKATRQLYLHFDVVKYCLNLWKSKGWFVEHKTEALNWALLFLYNSAKNTPYNDRECFSTELLGFLIDILDGQDALELPLDKTRVENFMFLSVPFAHAKTPFASIIVSCMDESAAIEEGLKSLEFQEEQSLEFLFLAPENKESKYACAIADFAKKDRRAHLLETRSAIEALAQAKGDYVMAVDAGCVFDQYSLGQVREVMCGEKGAAGAEVMTFADSMGMISVKDPLYYYCPDPRVPYKVDGLRTPSEFEGNLMSFASYEVFNKVFSRDLLLRCLNQEPGLSLRALQAKALMQTKGIVATTRPFVTCSYLVFKDGIASYEAALDNAFSEYRSIAAMLDRSANRASLDVSFARYLLFLFNIVRNNEARALWFSRASTIWSECFEAALASNKLSTEEQSRIALLKEGTPESFTEQSDVMLLDSITESNRANLFQVAEAWRYTQELQDHIEEFYQSISYRTGRAVTSVPRAALSMARKAMHYVNEVRSGNIELGVDKITDQPAVSIIVPVYNVEGYLRECLDSLISQKLRNIEIIVVNDGSTDSSPQICAEYAARDPRIRVINKENEGYGKSMNRGFAEARGEYIGICESDDFADPRMFRDLYLYAKSRDLDLVKANYYEHSEEGDVFQEPFANFTYRRVFDPRVEPDVLTVLPIIWSALYRKEMIVRENIRFNETPGASYQDTSFVFQVWASARRVAILPAGYLHYRVDRAGSSVRSSSKPFAVCGEYELSKKFIQADPEKWEAFSKMLNLLKLGTYRWNLERLSDDLRPAFAQRWREELLEADAEGTLDESFFAAHDWEMLTLLMNDPDAFMARFENGWQEPGE